MPSPLDTAITLVTIVCHPENYGDGLEVLLEQTLQQDLIECGDPMGHMTAVVGTLTQIVGLQVKGMAGVTETTVDEVLATLVTILREHIGPPE